MADELKVKYHNLEEDYKLELANTRLQMIAGLRQVVDIKGEDLVSDPVGEQDVHTNTKRNR